MKGGRECWEGGGREGWREEGGVLGRRRVKGGREEGGEG